MNLFKWREEEDDKEEEDFTMKDRINSKHKIMNIATVSTMIMMEMIEIVLKAMATLGMANTRGLEDPAVGPMLLSHASV